MLCLIPESNAQTRQQNSDEEICCKILNLIKFCKVSCNVVLIHNPDAQIYLHDLRQINYYRWRNMMDSAVIPNEKHQNRASGDNGNEAERTPNINKELFLCGMD